MKLKSGTTNIQILVNMADGIMADVNLKKAQSFISKYGQDLEKARTNILFSEEVTSTARRAILRVIQVRESNASGLLTRDYLPDQFPSVISTIQFLFAFQDALLAMNEPQYISELVQALTPYMNVEEGFWSETLELLQSSDRPDWADDSKPEIRNWISAYGTSILATVPGQLVRIDILRKGIKYLSQIIDEHSGGLKSVLPATFISANLFYSKMIGTKQDLDRTHDVLYAAISEAQYGSELGFMLDCLSHVTNPRVRPIVIEGLQRLPEFQLEDGSFTSEEGPEAFARASATTDSLVGMLRAEEKIRSFQRLHPSVARAKGEEE